MKFFHTLFLVLLLPAIALAQSVYEIKFTSGITQHRGALILWDDGTGKFRVRFFSNGSTHMVEQYIKTENTDLGLRITGYDPVYPGTTTPYSTYYADNFYISQDEDGNASCVNIDDKGQKSKCSIRTIEGYETRQKFLSDFDWKLN